MIQPQPFKLKCPKCDYSKIMQAKSDALAPTELIADCPTCKVEMLRVEMSMIDKSFIPYYLYHSIKKT